MLKSDRFESGSSANAISSETGKRDQRMRTLAVTSNMSFHAAHRWNAKNVRNVLPVPDRAVSVKYGDANCAMLCV